MAATIVGELSADDTRIVLMAASEDQCDLIEASRYLALCTPTIKTSKPPGALLCPASWPAVVQLAATFGTYWRPGPRLTEWVTDQVTARLPIAGTDVIPTPPGLTPRPYQISGARMIGALGRGLLFDDPGTGKTITSILGLIERSAHTEVRPIVVVCPASVVDPWVEAFTAWAPRWRTVAWRGPADRRHRLAGTADCYVTSYDTGWRDTGSPSHPGPLLKLRAASVICDESHLIKSSSANRSRAVRHLAHRAGTFVALSGTPITHHPGDLWTALDALAPAAWPSKERWNRRYLLSIPSDYKETILGLNPHHEPEFRDALLGQYRRVAKADVLTELPPKIYSIRTVELPAAYRRAYDEMASEMLAQMPDGTELSVMSVLAQLTRLSQLASAAADVITRIELDEHGDEVEHVTVTLKAPSWKVDELLEICAERPGQPVVAFSPSRQLITLAGEAAQKAGRTVGYVVGGQSMRERTETVAAFQNGELDLMCATTGAGGVGITLTAASTVVFLQRPWSLVEALQAEDRCHRIGSERHESIEVIDILAKNTVDTRVRSVLREKAGQLADLVADPRIATELLGGASVRRLRKAS